MRTLAIQQQQQQQQERCKVNEELKRPMTLIRCYIFTEDLTLEIIF